MLVGRSELDDGGDDIGRDIGGFGHAEGAGSGLLFVEAGEPFAGQVVVGGATSSTGLAVEGFGSELLGASSLVLCAAVEDDSVGKVAGAAKDWEGPVVALEVAVLQQYLQDDIEDHPRILQVPQAGQGFPRASHFEAVDCLPVARVLRA